MKYKILLPLVLAILVLGLSIMAIFAEKTRVAEKSPLQEIAQEGIKQPEGMPVVLEEGQTRETYYAKQTTMPKKETKTTKTTQKVTATPLAGSSAPIVTATAPTAPLEAPKQPSETFVPPTIVVVHDTAPAPTTATVTPQPAPVEELPLAFTANFKSTTSLYLVTNQKIDAGLVIFTGGVTLVSTTPAPIGANMVYGNTKTPAYGYYLEISGVEPKKDFTITVNTGTQVVTHTIQLNPLDL